MTSLPTIQKLSKLGKVLSNIAFIFSIVGCVGCLLGMIALQTGAGSVLKLGGVTIHGLVGDISGIGNRGITAGLCGWLVICVGQAVLAKFAALYFHHELAAGTPFTASGAKELLRLGILTIAIPLGCDIAGNIVAGIAAGFLQVEDTIWTNLDFDSSGSILLGIMFVLGSLLCRYGAELRGSNMEDSDET